MPEYLLLTRPECHLCEDFVEALREARPDLVSGIKTVDVDSREDWRQRFGLRIPVLIDTYGGVICEGVFDAAKLADTE